MDDISDKSEEDLSTEEQKKWSEAGLAHAPGKALGGVLVNSTVIREATINLIALRHLKAGDEDSTWKLREYILGLTLVCATLPQDYDLRSGCQLVRDGENASTAKIVYRDGQEEDFTVNHKAALEFAQQATTAFGVESDREVNFEKARADNYLNERANKKSRKSKSKKGNA